jgi:hypothetical protein
MGNETVHEGRGSCGFEEASAAERGKRKIIVEV